MQPEQYAQSRQSVQSVQSVQYLQYLQFVQFVQFQQSVQFVQPRSVARDARAASSLPQYSTDARLPLASVIQVVMSASPVWLKD